MSGSYIFYFHLLGFGLVSTLIIAGWILNLRFMSEKDLGLKLYVGGILRSMGLLTPVAALLLLFTGIGNIFNLYYGTPAVWYQQAWLVVKIILFGVMLVNGMIFGPIISRRRIQVAKTLKEQTGTEEDEKRFKYLNKQMNWFYVVQTVLLLGIVFFSVFGTSKHPGYL